MLIRNRMNPDGGYPIWTTDNETPLERVCGKTGHEWRLVSVTEDHTTTIKCADCGLSVSGKPYNIPELKVIIKHDLF